jgi:transposase
VGNHSGDQFTYDLFEKIWRYDSLSIADITEVFGIGRQTLSDLISAYKKVNGGEEE